MFNFAKLFEYAVKTKNKIIRIKALSIALLLCQRGIVLNPIFALGFPSEVPPYEKNHICLYTIWAINHFGTADAQSRLIHFCLTLIYPSESFRKYLKEYTDQLACGSG